MNRSDEELLKLVNINLKEKDKLIKNIYYSYSIVNNIDFNRLLETDPCDLKSLVDFSLIKSAMKWNGSTDNINEFIKYAYEQLEEDIYESLRKLNIIDVTKITLNEFNVLI